MNRTEILDTRLCDMFISHRLLNCLKCHDIDTVRDLVYRTKKDLMDMRNFGKSCLAEIKDVLAQFDLRLGMTKPEIATYEGKEYHETLDDRAEKAFPDWLSERSAYIVGAIEQKKIDIEKLRDVMNLMMLDTHDKAEILKAMEG